MNMVGVNSRQQKEEQLGKEAGLRTDSTFTATDLLEDVNNGSAEVSICDEGEFTPGSSVNGAQSQPTTRSDSKKSKFLFKIAFSYFKH